MARTRTLKAASDIEMIAPKVVEPGPVEVEVQLPPAEVVTSPPKPQPVKIQEAPMVNAADIKGDVAFNIPGNQLKQPQVQGGSLGSKIRKAIRG